MRPNLMSTSIKFKLLTLTAYNKYVINYYSLPLSIDKYDLLQQYNLYIFVLLLLSIFNIKIITHKHRQL